MTDNNDPTLEEQLDAIKVLLGACLKDLVVAKKDGSIPDMEQLIKTVNLSKDLADQLKAKMDGNDSEVSLAIDKTEMLLNESLKAISEAEGKFDKVLVINLTYYLALADGAIHKVLKDLEERKM